MAKIAQNRPQEWEIERYISFVKARTPRGPLFPLPDAAGLIGFKDFTFSLPSLCFLPPSFTGFSADDFRSRRALFLRRAFSGSLPLPIGPQPFASEQAAAPPMPALFPQGLYAAPQPYHSRVSAETGLGFRRISTTFPLLMRMILSAMAAKDWLWVMTTTVRPVSRQVSCRSFRMALPVL